MSYSFKATDVYDFARFVNAETEKKENGEELEFKYCPYCHGGEHRDKKTFSINLKDGQFKCLRGKCGKSGNIFTLAKDFKFHLDFGSQKPLKKQYRVLPSKPIESIEVKNSAVEFMKSRGISAEITKKYGITTQKNNDRVIVFPFYDWNGELVMVKYRQADYVKGKSKGSKEWTEKDTKPLLFGIQNINYENKTLVITEGQIDSLSLSEAGIENAVSVPNGKNAFEWINTCWDFLHNFDKIVVFGDCEDGKITLVEEINKKLTSQKVYCVNPTDYKGEKDANDILRKCGKQALIDAVNNARIVKVNHIIPLSDVKPINYNDVPHIRTGIAEIDETIGGLFFGQYIAITGKRGSGKSTLMSQFVCEALDQGFNTLVYSGELLSYQFKNWLDLQLAGGWNLYSQKNDAGMVIYNVRDKAQEKINEWYRDRLFIYDNEGLEEGEEFFEILEKAIVRYNIKLLCLDNLMTLTSYGSDNYYQQQSSVVMKIKALAVKHEMVCILIAHERKDTKPDTNDNISGSGDISNRADVVISFQRNHSKDKETPYDGIIQISKNRLFGKTRLLENTYDNNASSEYGAIFTIFDHTARRFSTHKSNVIVRYYGWECPDLPDFEKETREVHIARPKKSNDDTTVNEKSPFESEMFTADDDLPFENETFTADDDLPF